MAATPSPPVFSTNWRQSFAATPGGDPHSWSTTIPPGGNRSLNPGVESEFYSDGSVGVDPFSIDENGSLVITAAPGGPSLYTSGCLTSIGLFNQAFGRWAARIAMPGGTGFWPAFWLLPSNLQYSAELDVEEQWQGLQSVQETMHGMFKGIWQSPHAVSAVTDVTQFHTYAVHWGPKLTQFRIDGQFVATLPTPDTMQGPMFMILNLAVGEPGSWVGTPPQGAVGQMKVAWVKVWAGAQMPQQT